MKNPMKKELSEAGREQVALALILLKDFKRDPANPVDVELFKMIYGLAEVLGVRAEFDRILPVLPPMKITRLHPE